MERLSFEYYKMLSQHHNIDGRYRETKKFKKLFKIATYEILQNNENAAPIIHQCLKDIFLEPFTRVVTKVSKGIGMLRRIRQFVPKSTLLRICNAIVLSHFDYCSLVWDNCCEYLTDKLQKLQNRAARIITGKTYDVSSDDVLKELNWEPLKQRYKINKTIFMHKVRHNTIIDITT